MKYALILLFVFFSTYAYPYCSEPRAPSAPSTYSKPTKPRTPWCINKLANKAHNYANCEIRDLD